MEEIAPQEKAKGTPKRKKLMVRGYPNEALLQELADGAATTLNPATKRPFRRGGLPILITKEHGWPGEKQANTDGIWKYLIYCHKVRGASEKIREGFATLQGGR